MRYIDYNISKYNIMYLVHIAKPGFYASANTVNYKSFKVEKFRSCENEL